jgi:hypothetical protein
MTFFSAWLSTDDMDEFESAAHQWPNGPKSRKLTVVKSENAVGFL